MNKQQILEQIDELKQKIEVLEKKVNSSKFDEVKKGVRQIPKNGEKYFFLNDSGFICEAVWIGSNLDLFHFSIGNCFKTEQEAEDYKENLLTKQALKDLALELNEGVEIDWKDDRQPKHYLYIDHAINLLTTEYAVTIQENIAYCLDNQFLTIAKDRIGE